jgi:hypothetical protein
MLRRTTRQKGDSESLENNSTQFAEKIADTLCFLDGFDFYRARDISFVESTPSQQMLIGQLYRRPLGQVHLTTEAARTPEGSNGGLRADLKRALLRYLSDPLPLKGKTRRKATTKASSKQKSAVRSKNARPVTADIESTQQISALASAPTGRGRDSEVKAAGTSKAVDTSTKDVGPAKLEPELGSDFDASLVVHKCVVLRRVI